jgi:hypothetical protein
VLGTKLDGPAMAATLPLAAERAWRRGDRRSSTRTHESGGFQLCVSEHDGGHVPAQIDDALEFLTRYRESLAELQRCTDVEELYLDFAWDIPPRASVPWNRWPPELCRICGDLGIAIEATVYLVEREHPPDR